MQKMAGIIEQMNSGVCHFSETVCGLLQTKEIFFVTVVTTTVRLRLKLWKQIETTHLMNPTLTMPPCIVPSEPMQRVFLIHVNRLRL